MSLPAHSHIGASSASLWMKCPGSVALAKSIAGLDEDEEQEWTKEGTAAAIDALCHEWCHLPQNAPKERLLAVGDRLHAMTAVTTSATTAGRVMPAVLSGATSVLVAQMDNLIGKAMSAKTTANTNQDVLVHVGRF